MDDIVAVLCDIRDALDKQNELAARNIELTEEHMGWLRRPRPLFADYDQGVEAGKAIAKAEFKAAEAAAEADPEGILCICGTLSGRWRPTPTEPHRPGCPRYQLLEDGQLPKP